MENSRQMQWMAYRKQFNICYLVQPCPLQNMKQPYIHQNDSPILRPFTGMCIILLFGNLDMNPLCLFIALLNDFDPSLKALSLEV